MEELSPAPRVLVGDASSPPVPDADPLDPVSARRRWIITFSLLTLVITCWSFASPLYSGGDEPAHVIKAAAVVRGELRGRDVTIDIDEGAAPHPLDGGVQDGHVVSAVRVPAEFERADRIRCYVFQGDVPAGCAGAFPGSDSEAEVRTRAGRYPPPYYMAVGLPTLVFSSSAKAVYLMRLLNGLLCAAFLASAMSSASEMRCRFLVIGVAVGATPMALYLAGIVNPSGLMVSAGISLWISGLALLQGLDHRRVRRVAARTGLSASVLILLPGVSPLFLAMILLVLGGLTGRRRLGMLIRRTPVQAWLVVFLVASAFAVAWLVVSRSLELGPPTLYSSSQTMVQALRTSLGKFDATVRQMIGVFGWLDTPSPRVTYYLWFFLLGFLLVLGTALSSTRVVMAITAVVLATVVVPAVLQAFSAHTLGFVWQGRYSLPLAVGVPILAAFGLDMRRQALSLQLHRVAAVVMVALVVAHLSAFTWAMRRYTVGTSGKLLFFLGPSGWHPPAPAIVLLVAFATFVAALGWWLCLLVSPSSTPAVVTTALSAPLPDVFRRARANMRERRLSPAPAAMPTPSQGGDDGAG